MAITTQAEPLLPTPEPLVSSDSGSSFLKSATNLPPQRYEKAARWRSWALHMAGLLMLNFILNAGFLVSLYGFSLLDHLSLWPKRAFNTASIIGTALLSLGIGHLIGELGKAIRWKILASWPHQVTEIEFVLNIETPSAFRDWLVLRFRSKRRSSNVPSWRTGAILGVFLICNFLGRISVAMYGLVFNLEESINSVSALYATNMSAVWEDSGHDGTGPGVDMLYVSAALGLQKWGPTSYQDIFIGVELSNFTLDIDITGVTYSYIFPEYDSTGAPARDSNRTIKVHTKCDQFEVIDLGIDGSSSKRCNWTDPFCVTSGENPPAALGSMATWTLLDKDNKETKKQAYDITLSGLLWGKVKQGVVHDLTSYAASTDPRWVWNKRNKTNAEEGEDELDKPPVTVISVARDGLPDQIANKNPVVVVGPVDPDVDTEESFGTCVIDGKSEICGELWLLTGGAYNASKTLYSAKDIGFWVCQNSIVQGINFESGDNHTSGNTLGLTDLQMLELTGTWGSEDGAWSRLNGITKNSRFTPLPVPDKSPFHLFANATLIKNENRTAAELWIAGSLARATIAAIAYLDSSARSDSRIKLSDTEREVRLSLVVLWRRVWLITAFLSGVQALFVVIGFLWCRNVMLRDDHIFSDGKLVERLLREIEGGTTATGQELAEAIPFQVLYGTVDSEDGVADACLWKEDEVKGVFRDGQLYT